MAESFRHGFERTDSDWVRLERIADRFEEAWQQGRRPVLDDYLPPDPAADRLSILIELVHAEFEFRLGLGEPARVEDYLERYPALARDPDVVWELIAAEVELKRLRDPTLALDAYRARFPAFEQELVAHWRTLADDGGPEVPRLSRVARGEDDAGAIGPRPGIRTRLGKFALLEVLGRGAFGIVYRAWDTEQQRIVALKVPRSDLLANREEADRFLREARSVAALDHPCIVGAYEAGRIEETFYLASELIHGATLADRLATHALGTAEGVEVIARVAEALDLAHQRGVVHRDLKPSNILLDGQGCPHITDFGLAKREAGTSTVDPTLTVEGQVLGTPAYMSPEQARGEAREVDGRSDVYSLGVILYQI